MVTVFGVMTTQSSWQDRILEASHVVIQNGGPLQSSKDAIELFGTLDIDNTSSSQCSGFVDGFCVPCPDDKPLWWLVLRWLKMMLLKVARSYTGKPLLLVMFPLSVGLLIGYLLGMRAQLQQSTKDHPASRSSLFCMNFMNIRNWVAVVCSHFFLQDQSIPLKYQNADENKNKNAVALSPSCIDDKEFKETVVESRLKKADPDILSREENVRKNLKSDDGTQQESGVDPSQVPRHVAVIMDGNRRYGKEKYGNATRGHWDGSSKLVDFAKWCIAEKVSVLTVYAFSTENWNRSPDEVQSLMSIFSRYCDELRAEALKRNIKIQVLSTEVSRIPTHVKQGLTRMVEDTKSCSGLIMNICISYGSRGEIVDASRSLAADVLRGSLDIRHINENEFEKRLLTSHCGDPDVLIRTSGEVRISNFLLWQLAYTEMFFVEKPWPGVEKEDFLQVIRAFAGGRKRRFGK